MNQTERLIDLILSLLEAREPVSRDTIRGWFPEDYGGVSEEAFSRKFERDKADIIELGIPLRHVESCVDRRAMASGARAFAETELLRGRA